MMRNQVGWKFQGDHSIHIGKLKRAVEKDLIRQTLEWLPGERDA